MHAESWGMLHSAGDAPKFHGAAPGAESARGGRSARNSVLVSGNQGTGAMISAATCREPRQMPRRRFSTKMP